jgi:hypothetical protein
LIKLSLIPKRLEKPLQPIFSDSTSNYIDILETINQPEVVESSLRAPMEQALAAQKRFKIKKTYNLDHFSLEDAKRILVSGVTQKGRKEVSVVSELIAKRDKDELIVSFILKVGTLELVLDMRDVDVICGGVPGRNLFFYRNRHRARNTDATSPWKRRHGEKTSMKRVMSISAHKDCLAVRNFQHTAKEHEFNISEAEREKAEGVKFKQGKFKKRLKKWQIYKAMSDQAELINADNGMFSSLTLSIELTPEEILYCHNYYLNNNEATSFGLNKRSSQAPIIQTTSDSSKNPISQQKRRFIDDRMGDCSTANYFIRHALASEFVLLDIITNAFNVFNRMEIGTTYSMTAKNESSVSRKV